jgi:hypothetical protein
MWLEWVGIRGGVEELRVKCMIRGEMEHNSRFVSASYRAWCLNQYMEVLPPATI